MEHDEYMDGCKYRSRDYGAKKGACRKAINARLTAVYVALS